MNQFYLLRNGQVSADLSKPVTEWALSDLGRSEVSIYFKKFKDFQINKIAKKVLKEENNDWR